MFLASLILLGLCASFLALKRFLSLIVTLAFSLMCTVTAIFALLRPDAAVLNGAYLGLTPLRGWFLLILGVVSIAAAWYRFGYRDHNEVATSLWLPLFLISMVGVISAQNVWVFMTSWEMMSVTSFFLVISDRSRPGTLQSGYVYLVMSQLSAVAILSGFLLMGASVHSMDFTGWSSSAGHLPPGLKSWIFALLGFGFAVKSGMIPFHIWLPRAHPIAPAPVSGLMSGVMIKLGVFGVIQFLLIDLGPTQVVWSIVLFIAGSVSSLLGVLYALLEHDLKRLLAYSSIENIGIIFLGLSVMAFGVDLHLPSVEALGLVAALFHTLNHAIFKSQLFLAAGAVEQHTGTLDIESLGGLIRTIPWIAVGFLAGSMAISALPPFNGFISEWLTFRGVLTVANGSTALWVAFGLAVALVLAMTSALAGLCFVKATGVIFLGQPRQQIATERVPQTIILPILALGVLNLVLGVFPIPITKVITSVQSGIGSSFGMNLVPVHASTTALLLIVIVTVVLVLSRPWAVREVPRWSCGRIPDASMQFTSSSFTKAVRTTLAVIYRPHRKLTRIGPYAGDFPEKLFYEGGTTPIWERYLYRPGVRLAWWLSANSTKLQAGPVRLYLVYLLGTVAIMLLLLH